MCMLAVQFGRLSDQEAAASLKLSTCRTVQLVEGLLKNKASTTVSCGTGQFKKTDSTAHCRMAVKYAGQDGVDTCTAAKIGKNRLATAAHCIYDREAVSYGCLKIAGRNMPRGLFCTSANAG